MIDLGRKLSKRQLRAIKAKATAKEKNAFGRSGSGKEEEGLFED